MKVLKNQPVSKKYIFPTVEEMKETLSAIELLLKMKQLNMAKNYPIKEGLTDCTRILNERIDDPTNDWFYPEKNEDIQRSVDIYNAQLKGISDLQTVQGRSIAVMCVDYLNGAVSREAFLKAGDMIKLR